MKIYEWFLGGDMIHGKVFSLKIRRAFFVGLEVAWRWFEGWLILDAGGVPV